MVTVTTAAAFGLSRMQPFPDTTPVPYRYVELDPASQTARYLDGNGNPIPAWDKHRKSGTSKETSTITGDCSGGADQGHDQAGDTD
jgi:putative ATP-grasp target RiPP